MARNGDMRIPDRRADVRPPSCIYESDLDPPKVFISSTFEDRLVEIRAQLRKALIAAEFRPVMSELDSFSSMGDRVYEDTIAAVRGCQLFVLLIGHRYGSRHPQLGKSITHLEYLAARDAGMRILVYVDDSLWQIFQDRHKGVGDALVASAPEREDVFAFLEQVAEKDNCRCVAFKHSDEILSSLRHQSANLLGAYLRFQAKAVGWIWTERYTHGVEKNAKVVWVLTPDFYWDYADTEFNQLVRANVATRGTKYFYLYKQDDDSKSRIREMMAEYDELIGQTWKDSVFFAGIPESQFFWCAEQVLYNPGDPSSERGIFVDTMSGRNKEHKFDVELGRDRRAQFRHHFQRLWSLYSDEPLLALSTRSGALLSEQVEATHE